MLKTRSLPHSYTSRRLASTSTNHPEQPLADPTSTPSPSETFYPDSLEGLEERDPSSLNELLRPNLDDHVGFLKDNYDIDFGWGTSSIMKAIFENIHIFTGWEYVASIVATGIAARILCVPFISMVSNNAARLQAVSKITAPINARAKEAAANRDQSARMQAYQELRQVYKRVGASPWKTMLGLVQMPIGFGCWRTFSNMAHENVAGLSTGGAFWFTNLTIPDPFFLLPLATTAMQYLSFKTTTEVNPSTDPAQRKIQKVMVYLPVIFLPIISFAPATVQLHFLTTSCFAFLTNMGLRNQSVRAMLGMIPRITVAPPTIEPAYKGTINVSAQSRRSSTSSAPPSAKVITLPTTPPAPPTPSPSRHPIAWLKRKAVNGLKNFTEATDSLVPGAVKNATQGRRKSAAETYEEKRGREIADERAAYQRRLEGKRMARKR